MPGWDRDRVSVTCVRDPFDPFASRLTRKFEPGLTVAQCLDKFRDNKGGLNFDVVVSLDGQVIDDFDLVPHPGSSLVFCAVVAGGGDRGKDMLRTVAMIAVTVTAMAVSGGAGAGFLPGWGFTAKTAALINAAVISVGGTYLINQLLPASVRDNAVAGSLEESQTYGFDPPSNPLREGLALPILYGVRRITPQVISRHVTTDGDNQAINMLFALCYGEVSNIGSIEINGNPITGYTGVTADSRAGTNTQTLIAGFEDVVTEKLVGTTLDMDYTTVTTDGTDTQGLGVGFTFPGGLSRLDGSGNINPLGVNILIEYKRIGDVSWTSAGSKVISSNRQNVVRRFFKLLEPSVGVADQYQIRAKFDYNPVRLNPTLFSSEPIVDLVYVEIEPISTNKEIKATFAPGTDLSQVLEGMTVVVTGSSYAYYHGSFTVVSVDNVNKAIHFKIVYLLVPADEIGTPATLSLTSSTTYQNVQDADVDFELGRHTVNQNTFIFGCRWDYIQEFVPDDFTYPNTALLSVTALATDQLNGSAPQVTTVVTRGTVQVWTGAAYEAKASSNPAWACYDLLHNTLYGAGIPYTRLNYAEFAAWATYCDTVGKVLECHLYIDQGLSLAEALNEISTCGRGSVVQRGLNFGVVIDKATSPVQLFSEGNIVADSLTETYLDRDNRANAIEISYFDADIDYERTTVELRGTDFDANESVSKVNSIVLTGVTDREQAIRHGKFLLNCNEYLIRTISFSADVDAIAIQPGDVFSFQHHVPIIGQGGRIVSATAGTVKLDKQVTLQPATTYTVMARLSSDDSMETKTVAAVLVPTTTDTLTLTTNWSTTPSKYDVYAFGESTVMVKEFRCISIARTQDTICKIEALEYSDDVYDDAATINDIPARTDLAGIRDLYLDDNFVLGQDGVIRAVIDANWRGFAVKWQVFVREQNQTWTRAGTTNKAQFQITGVDIGKTYEVAVSTTDSPTDGVSGTVLVEIDPPEQVTGILSEIVDNFVKLTWNPSTSELPIGYYEVRRGPVYAAAMLVGRADKTFTTDFVLDSGDFTYWVTPVNTRGDAGTPQSTVVTLELPDKYRVQDAFVGDLSGLYATGVEQEDGSVILPVLITETWAQHFTTNGLTSFDEFIAAGYTYYWEPNAYTGPSTWYEDFPLGATFNKATIVLDVDFDLISGDSANVSMVPTFWINDDFGTEWVGSFTQNFEDVSKVSAQLVVTVSDPATKIQINSITLRNITKTTSDSGSATSVVNIKASLVSITSPGSQAVLTLPSTDLSQVVAGDWVVLEGTSSDGIYEVDSVDDGADTITLVDDLAPEAGVGTVSIGKVVEFNVTFSSVDAIVVTPLSTAPRYAIHWFDDSISNPQRFIVFLFDDTGTRVTGKFNWAATGV